MEFGRLKDLRDDFEKSQTEVAEALKITRQQYSLYETGKRTIPVDLLIKLALYYNTSTDYILGVTNKIAPYERNKKMKVRN